MTNFIYDNTALYLDKVDPNPVTIPTQQWAAADAALVKQALLDIRTVLQGEHANVRTFGAVGDGVTDDAAAIQAAINATQGIPLYFPRGLYRVNTTLNITTRSHRLVGDFGNRFADGGSEIQFFGTGPCIQIGTDNGHSWDANDYDGPQDQRFENLWISHGAPDTNLVSTGVAGVHYKAGAYGIWDWRGGQIVIKGCGIEKFEANFVGIQSDIDDVDGLTSIYSKFGLYFGPRSDQLTLSKVYSFFCDRAITLDRCGGPRILDAQLVGCGTSTTSAIEVRQGTSSVTIARPWFEHVQGYAGTDQLSFVSVGEVAGYGAGGSIAAPGGAPTTASVEVLTIEDPMCYTVLGGIATHTKYVASVGKCHRFSLNVPATLVGNSLTNFDSLVGIQASQSPSNADTQISIDVVDSSTTLAKMYTNLGGGAPAVSIRALGASGYIAYSTSPFGFYTPGAVVGADQVQLTQSNVAGNLFFSCPTYTGGQTTRLRIARSQQTATNAASPSIGAVEQGDRCIIIDPADGGYAEWICIGSGNPGTWRKAGLLTLAGILTLPDGSAIGASAANATPIKGSVSLAVAANTLGLLSNNVTAGQVSAQPCIRGLHNGTFDTTGGFQSAVALQGQAVATRSAGASTLQNIGGQFTASGGQANLALQTLAGDVDLNSTGGATILNKSVRLSNELVPAAIAANQNDYSPANLADAAVLIVSATAPFNITGIATPVAGRRLLVYNSGANAITLTNQDAASTAANRIIGRGAANTVLTANTGVELYYSPSITRWLVMTDTL